MTSRAEWMNACNLPRLSRNADSTLHTHKCTFMNDVSRKIRTQYTMYIHEWKPAYLQKISMYSSIVISIYLNTNIQVTTKKVVCVFVDHGLCIYLVVVFFENCQFILNEVRSTNRGVKMQKFTMPNLLLGAHKGLQWIYWSIFKP